MLSIIIPANTLKKKTNPKFFYKKKFNLDDTIESIASNIDVEFELIIVVNDIENHELLDYIKTSKYVNKFVLNSTNVGVARAWNIGAHMAEGKYLCFCNDDVEFTDAKVFSNLLNIFQEHERIGQIGPEGGKWFRDKSGERLGLKTIEEVDEISGYFFIIPADIFHKTGGFDNFYTPAGCEEIDMSFQIRNIGYKCLVVPKTGIIHHGSHGISSKRTNINYLNREIDTLDLDVRNKEYFVKKWY